MSGFDRRTGLGYQALFQVPFTALHDVQRSNNQRNLFPDVGQTYQCSGPFRSGVLFLSILPLRFRLAEGGVDGGGSEGSSRGAAGTIGVTGCPALRREADREVESAELARLRTFCVPGFMLLAVFRDMPKCEISFQHTVLCDRRPSYCRVKSDVRHERVVFCACNPLSKLFDVTQPEERPGLSADRARFQRIVELLEQLDAGILSEFHFGASSAIVAG